MPRNTPRFLPVALALTALPGYCQVCVLGARPPAYRSNLDQGPDARAAEIVKRIGAAFSATCMPRCPTVGIFSNTTALYVMVFTSPGAMKIVYAPTFWTNMSTRYGEDALIGLVAHEYGHVIDSVVMGSWMNVGWTTELRADAWAGCALATINLKSGSIGQALTAMRRYPSTGKPVWTARIAPLRAGYAHCGGSTRDFDNGAAALESAAKKKE